MTVFGTISPNYTIIHYYYFSGTYNWASVASLGENVTFSCLLYKNESEPALPDNHQVVTGTERWQLPGKSELIGPWIDGRFVALTSTYNNR